MGLALQTDWPEVSQRAAEHGGNPAARGAALMAAVGGEWGGSEVGSGSRGLLGGMEAGVQPEQPAKPVSTPPEGPSHDRTVEIGDKK